MLQASDFAFALKMHPNSCSATYAGGTATGVFSNVQDKYFNEVGSLVYINNITFAYLTDTLPIINRKTNPTIEVKGITYKIKNATNESSLVTSLELEQ